MRNILIFSCIKICIWLLLRCIRHLLSAVHKYLQYFVIDIIIIIIDWDPNSLFEQFLRKITVAGSCFCKDAAETIGVDVEGATGHVF